MFGYDEGLRCITYGATCLPHGVWHVSASGDALGFTPIAVGTPWWLWLIVPAVIGLLLLLGLLLHAASRLCAEKLQASQAARLFELLGSLADGAAETLLAHPPAPASTVLAVRNGLIAAGVAYARDKMPDTIKALGVDDATIAARLGREIAGKLLDATAPTVPATAPALAPAPAAA